MKQKSEAAAKYIALSLEKEAKKFRSNSGIWRVYLNKMELGGQKIQSTTMGLESTVRLVGNNIDRSKYKYRKGKKGESPQYYEIANIKLADLSDGDWL